MYLDFYNLKEEPFSATPSERYFYPAAPHSRVMSLVAEAVKSQHRIMVLTGPEATGKTTLLAHLCKHLVQNNAVDKIYCQRLNVEGTSSLPCREYRTGTTASSFSELVRHLTSEPGESAAPRATSLLILDNAEHVQRKHLHDIRSIMRFEAGRGRVLKMLLVGPFHLVDKLEQLRMHSAQRAALINIALNKMSTEDTRLYINHRLNVAAATANPGLFTSAALDRLHQFSGGIAGRINKLCNLSLSYGCGSGTPLIDADIVEHAGIEYIHATFEERPSVAGEDFCNIHTDYTTHNLLDAFDESFNPYEPQATEPPQNGNRVHVLTEGVAGSDAHSVLTPALPREMIQEANMIIENLTTTEQIPRVVGFTSAVAREGTSTISSLVATVAAVQRSNHPENGTQTYGSVLVDSQTSSPSLHDVFSLSIQPGLRQVLEDQTDLESAIRATQQPALKILTAGGNGENSLIPVDVDSLGLLLKDLRGKFERIFIDIPPVLHSADALRICKLCDAVVLVVRAGGTRWQIVDQARKLLQGAGVNLLGSVLNQREFLIPEGIYRRL